MKQQSILAYALVALCATTAVGSWFASGGDAHVAPAPTVSLGGAARRDADIARLDLTGVIMDHAPGGFTDGGVGAREVLAAIAEIRKDAPPALLLDINSPGGSAPASQAIYEAVRKLKADTGIKVVAAMGDVAASGGYYVAAAADQIVANPSTMTGSIGVIMHATNVQGLYQKLGLSDVTIKSGKHKDIGSATRPVTPEEHALLQGIVDDTYQQFLAAVSEGRKIPPATLKPLADGRIFTGKQAKAVRLVDVLGNGEVALETLRKLADLPEDAKVETYGEPSLRRQLKATFGVLSAPFGGTSFGRILSTGALDRIPLALYE